MQCPNCFAPIYEDEIDQVDPICPECGIILTTSELLQDDPYDEDEEDVGGSDDELTQADLDDLLKDMDNDDDEDEDFGEDDDEFDEEEDEDE